jgi:D-glycero-D-manno-heptose 1,7-bisphosphate phosphatase
MAEAAKGSRRAVFLDRDGTIAEEAGYLNHISRFQMFPYSGKAIARLNAAGLLVIVITNQSGVARGFYPEALVHRVHDRMEDELRAAGAHVDGIYYCPHISADGCDCRKPSPGMLERAAEEHNLKIAGSTIVSDRYDDIRMGHDAGCWTILVLTGYGRGEYEWNRKGWAKPPHHVVENLEEAVEIVLREMK